MTVGENVLYLKDVNKAIERIAELEKENEQLKSDLYNTDANLQHITIEYEEKNAEIKQIIERERVVPEHYLCEMIEKIHCCQMCKHLLDNGACLKGDNEEVKKMGKFSYRNKKKEFL